MTLFSWLRRPAVGQMARVVASGTAVTLGGATVSCVLALCVERAAHRTLYRFFPHWYKNVDYAFGLEPYELEAVRNIEPQQKSSTIKEGEQDSMMMTRRVQPSLIDDSTTIFTNELQVAPLWIPLEKNGQEQRLRHDSSTILTRNYVCSSAMTA